MPDDRQQEESTIKWRERAKEMRDLARNMHEPETRATILKLADLYDHLADVREGAPKRR